MHDAELGLVLAAGGSTRMGRPKALLAWRGRPWLLHHLDALGPVCARLRVVLGGHAEAVRAVLPAGVEGIENPDWATTDMAASLRLGLAGLDEGAAVLVSPVDAAPASPALLAALLAAGPPAVPSWQGRDGHPVLVRAGPARAAPHLRAALAGATRVQAESEAVLANLNTPEAWARFVEGMGP